MSVWAGRCPSCGARLPQAGSTRRPPSPPPAPQPGRARRRLDGWVLVVPLLAAGLLIGLTVWVRAHAGPTGPARPPASTIPSAALGADLSHRILVEGDQARLRFFHLDGTAEADVTVPPTTEAPRPLAVGTALVFTAARQARVIADPPAGAVRALGPADRLIRAVNPGQLWLVRDQDQAPATVQLACVPGPGVACSAFPAPRQVPAGMRPVASLAGGLLLVAARPDVIAPAEMWDPFADRVVFRFPAAFGDVIDTHLNVVVWRSGGPGVCTGGVQCPLHITDVGSGQDQLIPAPPGSSGYMGGGALSPDGSYWLPSPLSRTKTAGLDPSSSASAPSPTCRPSRPSSPWASPSGRRCGTRLRRSSSSPGCLAQSWPAAQTIRSQRFFRCPPRTPSPSSNGTRLPRRRPGWVGPSSREELQDTTRQSEALG